MKIKMKASSQRAAVEWALGEVGTKTSLETLCAMADTIYDGTVSYAIACTTRSKYRKEHGDNTINTTYAGQPRRDQGNDEAIDFSQLAKMHAFFGHTATPDSLLELFKSPTAFHSMEQIVNAVEAYKAASNIVKIRKAA